MAELDDDREGIEPETLDEDAGDPAAAFDALRRTIETQGAQIGAEMTVMRRGLEAAFDQLDKIEPQTDYKPQLAQLVQALDTVAERLHGVEQSPILKQGAQHYAAALERSGEALIRTAAQQLERQEPRRPHEKRLRPEKSGFPHGDGRPCRAVRRHIPDFAVAALLAVCGRHSCCGDRHRSGPMERRRHHDAGGRSPKLARRGRFFAARARQRRGDRAMRRGRAHGRR